MNGHKKERKPITEIDVAMILLLIFLALGALGFLSVIPRKFWLLPSLVLISYFCYKISEAIGEKQKGRQCTEKKEQDAGNRRSAARRKRYRQAKVRRVTTQRQARPSVTMKVQPGGAIAARLFLSVLHRNKRLK